MRILIQKNRGEIKIHKKKTNPKLLITDHNGYTLLLSQSNIQYTQMNPVEINCKKFS